VLAVLELAGGGAVVGMSGQERIRSFAEFYPFYLAEHANRVCRRLHFVGTSMGLVLALGALVTQTWFLLPVAVGTGYAFAWVGHFFFERNRPAAFKQPVYSYLADWRLWWEILTRTRPF